MSLGTNLYTLRTRAGMSQDALAEKLEVSRQSVSKWETDASIPELEKLIKLSELYNVTLDELIRGDVRDLPPEIEEPLEIEEPPELPAKRPPVSHGRLVAGNALLISGLALPLAFLLFWGADGLFPGVLFDLILIPCGILLRKCPKRAELWCAWVVWLWADAYTVYTSGISTGTVLALFEGFNPELLRHMSAQIIVSGVMLASFAGMTGWTLWSFRRTPLPRTWGNIALVAAVWLGRLAMGPPTSFLIRALANSGIILVDLIFPLLLVLQDLLTAAAIVSTVALLQKGPAQA